MRDPLQYTLSAIKRPKFLAQGHFGTYYFPMKKLIKGVIFDLDGTLIDSQLNFDQMRNDLGIKDNMPVLEFIEQHKDQEFQKWAHQVVLDHEMKGAKNSVWINGALNFIEEVQNNDLPTAILTRNCRQAVDIMIEKHRIPIESVLTREDCLPKPNPAGLIQIYKEWKLKAQEILYVGDFYFDLETARRANTLFALYVNSQQQPDFAQEADYVFNNYSDLAKKIL